MENNEYFTAGLDDTISYEDGDAIEFTIDNKTWYPGTIKGLSINGLVHQWIVEGEVPGSKYPWSCFTIPGSCIRTV